MAKPNQAKEPELKPEKDKLQESSGSGNSILINIITTTIVCIIFIGVNYFLQSNLLTTQLKNVTTEQSADEGTDEPLDKPEKGIVLDLGDFTMNLSDIEPRRYLKANVAIEITNPEPDPTQVEEPKKESGHGGHGAETAPDPKANIVAEMEQYKPAIRDAVITVLTSKTSDELATTAGKELAKQQIAESVNGIFDGEREVIRVSFGQFIMQ